jgi:hypothetical protein
MTVSIITAVRTYTTHDAVGVMDYGRRATHRSVCRFIYLDLQTIAYILYRAHQIASYVLVSI